MSTSPNDGDREAGRLHDFGYDQVLLRTMSGLRSTLVNISTSSVTTAIFTLFAFGLLTGGTSFVWAYALGFAVLLLVTLMFAELGSDMPIAGALYQWASRVVGPRYGYVSAWIYIAAQIGITGAVAYGIAPFVGSLFNWELTVGQTQLMAIAIVVVCLLINLVGVRVASAVASLGAAAEVAGMLVLTVVLLVAGWGNQSPSILFESHGLPDGSAFLPVALATMLFGSWAYTGIEMTTDMAEETKDASRVIPRAAIGSLITTFVVGMVFLVVAVLAIPGDSIFASANPLQAIIEGNTSAAFYKVMLVVVIVAVFACTIANQALTARAMFSLARDGKAPGARALMKVPQSTRVPSVALTVVTVLTVILLLFTDAIATIAVAALTALFVVYMMVIWAQLVQRVRGRWTPRGWNLGRHSTTVNVLAAVLGTALTLNIAWPRGEGIPWYNKWSGFLYVGVAIVLALAYYGLGGRKVREAIERPLAGSGAAPSGAPAPAPESVPALQGATPASETAAS